MKALVSFVCIALLVEFTTANSVESMREEVDEEVPFSLDDAQYLSPSKDENIKMSTDRSPTIFRFLITTPTTWS